MNTNRDLTNETGYIYKITSPLGDVYIGQTINIRKRKHAYKKEQYKKQTKLWNNCQKYNWNPANTFEVIEECLCGEDKLFLNVREIYWVSYYDSYKNGLNCTEGGKGQVGRYWTEEQKEKQTYLINSMYEKGEIKLNPLKGHNLSEEHKEKIRNSSKEYFLTHEHWNTGTILSDETKQKISNSVKGEKNGFYGKIHTKEVREKMSKSHKGVNLSSDHRKNISEALLKVDQSNYKKHTVSVSQYDLEGNFICKFDSIKEAAEKTCSTTPGIIRVCKGRRKSTNNYIWKYN